MINWKTGVWMTLLALVKELLVDMQAQGRLLANAQAGNALRFELARQEAVQ
jgi:hypothetical protein